MEVTHCVKVQLFVIVDVIPQLGFPLVPPKEKLLKLILFLVMREVENKLTSPHLWA